MVDATDLKSVDRKIVRVQVPLPPLLQRIALKPKLIKILKAASQA